MTPGALQFVSSVVGLSVSVDGSGSADAEGGLTYSWDFGDGSSSVSGVVASHVYAAAGAYAVTLTVTDAGGLTASVSHDVTVEAPPVAGVLAQDSFSRVAVNGFGAADVGGAWVSSSTASAYAVNGGSGSHAMTSAGQTRQSYLSGFSAGDVTAVVDVWFDQVPTGGGSYSSLAVRRTGTSDYRVRVRAMPTSTTLTLSQVVNGTETSLAAVSVPGLVYGSGDVLRVKFEATGSSPTTLRAKVWKVGSAEPADWQVSATNSAVGLQGSGGIGLISYLSGSSSAPAVTRYDNLLVTGG